MPVIYETCKCKVCRGMGNLMHLQMVFLQRRIKNMILEIEALKRKVQKEINRKNASAEGC